MKKSMEKDLKKPQRFEKLRRHMGDQGMPNSLDYNTTQAEAASTAPGSVKLPPKKKK